MYKAKAQGWVEGLKRSKSLPDGYPFSRRSTRTDSNTGRLTPSKPLSSSSPVKLGAGDTLKVILTTQDGKSAKRPHQAFLLLQDPITNLDISYPLSVKDSGKAKVELVRSTDAPSWLWPLVTDIHSTDPERLARSTIAKLFTTLCKHSHRLLWRIFRLQ